MAIPGLVVLALTALAPLGWILVRSVADGGWDDYGRLFAHSYLASFRQTIYIAFVVAIVTTALAYPFAYALKTGPKWLRAVLVATLVISFASADVSRTFGWQTLLQNTGVINVLLKSVGVIEQPLPLMYNDFGTVLGTSSVLLPFGAMTIYANLRNVNTDVVLAAQTLGARRLTAVMRILVPMTVPGIAACAGLIFVLTLGFYVTPARLGDPKQPMISGLIVDSASFGDFGRAAAMSVVLLVLAVIIGGLVSGGASLLGKRSSK
ncbi:ABC transporter permease [Acrocarpospora macrocephala]|nr:ABC transporter permease [Acrocarpospora macrocephala]